MSRLLPSVPEWLRAPARSLPDSGPRVDQENKIILGYVVAQEGPFKSEGRGEFDRKSLKAIVSLMKGEPNGLKSRFTHPDLSSDGLGKFLGRARNPRIDTVTVRRDGENVDVEAVRADLHLDPTSFDTPSGDLGGYVMRLAESDPAAFSSSLVLRVQEEFRLDNHGKPRVDDAGEPLPPLWRPIELHASDVVDTGDAVDAFLDAEGLPDSIIRRGAAMLDAQFAGQSREVVEARCRAWLHRYLDRRFGEQAIPDADEALHVAVQLGWRDFFSPI